MLARLTRLVRPLLVVAVTAALLQRFTSIDVSRRDPRWQTHVKQPPTEQITGAEPEDSAGDNSQWRRWLKKSGKSLGQLTLVFAIPALLFTWYSSISSTPYAPLADGRLYLVVDRPNVQATLDIFLRDLQADSPTVDIGVHLSDPNARFALLAQGAWAFDDYPELRPKRSTTLPPRPATFIVDPASTSFSTTASTPSVVVVGSEYKASDDEWLAYGRYFISGHLHAPVEVFGRGRYRGTLPPIFGSPAALGESVQVTSVDGDWLDPEQLNINLDLAQFSGFYSKIAYSDPPAHETMSGMEWSTSGSLTYTRWEAVDQDASDRADQQIFLIGILLGLWGAVLLALVV